MGIHEYLATAATKSINVLRFVNQKLLSKESANVQRNHVTDRRLPILALVFEDRYNLANA